MVVDFMAIQPGKCFAQNVGDSIKGKKTYYFYKK
jgi:hypothetical protein